MSKPAIIAENLSKAYRIGLKEKIPDTAVGSVKRWMRAPLANFRQLRRLNTFDQNGHDAEDTLWALRDVSFEVTEGDVVGIIGRNGAGKSTLLKILSRITEPTRGEVQLRGRVSSLLEVGTGFHPELTGRENVYMNGTILGMRKREIDRKFDEIVDFSGVEKFLETPVKRYSSGMQVRLAFAVAAHLEPEILIIDEVLAVGDAEFQRKCLGKMNDVATGGRTVLFVSHNMVAVEGLCSHGIVLEQGRLVFDGPAPEAISQYARGRTRSVACEVDLREHPQRTLRTCPAFTSLRLTDDTGATLDSVGLGDPVTFELELRPPQRLVQAGIGIHIYDLHGRRVVTCHSEYQSSTSLELRGETIVRCRMESCRLMPGQYAIVLSLICASDQIDLIEPALEFEVVPKDVYRTGKLPAARDGLFVPEVNWSIDQCREGAWTVSAS